MQQGTGAKSTNVSDGGEACRASQVYQHDPGMMISIISPFNITWQAATQPQSPAKAEGAEHELQDVAEGGDKNGDGEVEEETVNTDSI